MGSDLGKVRADFDRLAELSGEGWDHNAHYHGFLVGQLPSWCREALDVGCGTGGFARLLAGRCERVLAIDLAPLLARMRDALAPGGTLLLLDVYRPRSPADLAVSLLAVPAARLLRLRHTDRYLTLAEIRTACAGVLPGASVRRHLLWRYSIVWRRAG